MYGSARARSRAPVTYEQAHHVFDATSYDPKAPDRKTGWRNLDETLGVIEKDTLLKQQVKVAAMRAKTPVITRQSLANNVRAIEVLARNPRFFDEVLIVADAKAAAGAAALRKASDAAVHDKRAQEGAVAVWLWRVEGQEKADQPPYDYAAGAWNGFHFRPHGGSGGPVPPHCVARLAAIQAKCAAPGVPCERN